MNDRKGLDRYLSRLDVWALSLSCIIGWGAFVMPGTTFLPIAGPLGTMIAIILSTLTMCVIGVNYYYLMVKNPGIGGVYAYTKGTLGRGHAFLSAWFLCLSYLALIPQNATAFAVMCRALFSGFVEQGLHYSIAGYDMYLREAVIAIAALVGIGILAIHCKPFLQRLQTVLAVVLLAGVLGIAGLILTKVPFAQVLSTPGFGSANPAVAIFSIIVLSPWAFVGFEVISLETAHFRFPVHRSKKLIYIAIILGGTIYIAMSVVAIAVVPDGYANWQAYFQDLGRFKGYAALPTFYATREALGGAGLVLIGMTAMAAVISSVIGFYRAAGRILSNMADDGIVNARFADPKYCMIFLMSLSVGVSLLGRNALSWVVDLSSLGAIVGFGYTSFVAWRTAQAAGEDNYIRLARLGMGISIIFGLTQLMPRIFSIEPMQAQSHFLLALWCLLGFAFYWRTIQQGANDHGSETTTISALFVLQVYASLVWFLKKLVRMGDGMTASAIIIHGGLFALLVLSGLLVMLRVLVQMTDRQKMLETERIHALESSRAKSRFLFNMSHDIRTPMNAIMGFTHLAKKPGVTAEEKDRFLEKIDVAGEQLLSIINDVLDMSEIENDQMRLHAVPTDIARAVMETGSLVEVEMAQKRIAYSVEVDKVAHPWVMCDRNRLNRIILNLLSNALKFTDEGGAVQMTLEEIGADREAVKYRIRIKDDGIGMDAAFAENVFSPFSRERTSTDSGLTGTGLGLSIVKGLVDAMGGDIHVQTEQGKGTEVTVNLSFPAAEEPPREEAAPSAQQIPAKLLLVEDNLINMEIASMILTQAGFEVDTAENGQIALEKVSKSQPGTYDCVLMDIQMPVMDGYEATKAIRALEDARLAAIPIIAMTANAFTSDKKNAESVGMQGHIAKPLDVAKMMETIQTVLQESRRAR